MNHNRTFTTFALTVFVGGVIVLFLFGAQPATAFNCLPYDQITSTQLVPCNNLFKREIRNVVFPGATYTREPQGTGKCAFNVACCVLLAPTECWPQFLQPEITSGSWRMEVISMTTTGHTSVLPRGLSKLGYSLLLPRVPKRIFR